MLVLVPWPLIQRTRTRSTRASFSLEFTAASSRAQTAERVGRRQTQGCQPALTEVLLLPPWRLTSRTRARSMRRLAPEVYSRVPTGEQAGPRSTRCSHLYLLTP